MRYDNIPELTGAAKVRVGGFGHCVSDLRRLILDVVSEIDRLCQKHGIEYFLFDAALRGAAIFHGFLPWDFNSTLRLFMARDKYKRFKEICAEELDSRYLLTDHAEDDEYRVLEAQVSIKDTVCINAAAPWRGRNVGVRADIIVADYLSDAPALRARQMKALSTLHRAVCPWDPQTAIPRRWLDDALLSVAIFLFGRRAVVRRLENVLSSAGSENSSSLLPVCNSPEIALGTSFGKEHFESSRRVPFEHLRLPLPANPLKLLCKVYGGGRESAPDAQCPNENAAAFERALRRYSPALFKDPPKSVNPVVPLLFHPKMDLENIRKCAGDTSKEKLLLKFASKSRSYNERKQKYLATMSKNTKIVRSCCNATIVNDTLTENRSAIDEAILDRNYKYLCGICEILGDCGIVGLEGIDPVLPRCADLFFRVGDIFTADALIKRMALPEADGDALEASAFFRKTADFLEAYYAVYENRDSAVSLAVGTYANECCTLVDLFRGILSFWANDLASARKFLVESVGRNENLFLGHYYLGLCHKRNGETRDALAAFADALESTLFMPDLALAMEQIESLSQPRDKVDSC